MANNNWDKETLVGVINNMYARLNENKKVSYRLQFKELDKICRDLKQKHFKDIPYHNFHS